MIPYFEGDFWPDEIENLLEQFEKTNTSRKFVSNDSFEPKEPTEVRYIEWNLFLSILSPL